jgi:hypothetical protein
MYDAWVAVAMGNSEVWAEVTPQLKTIMIAMITGKTIAFFERII